MTFYIHCIWLCITFAPSTKSQQDVGQCFGYKLWCSDVVSYLKDNIQVRLAFSLDMFNCMLTVHSKQKSYRTALTKHLLGFVQVSPDTVFMILKKIIWHLCMLLNLLSKNHSAIKHCILANVCSATGEGIQNEQFLLQLQHQGVLHHCKACLNIAYIPNENIVLWNSRKDVLFWFLFVCFFKEKFVFFSDPPSPPLLPATQGL